MTTTGGGSGSTTIGQQISVSSGNVSLSNEKVKRALDEKSSALIQSLNAIKQQLASSSTDVRLVEQVYTSLKNT